MNFWLNSCVVTLVIIYTMGQETTTSSLEEKKKCPKPNEIWNTCGTSCPEYCGEPKPQICIEMCVAGCECRKGFVKERTTGKCISRRRCARLEDPCARVRCIECSTCKKDTKNVPHCIPMSDNCCPSPLTKVQCFVDPCQVNKCSYPNATCISYYCGGCEAHFYDKNWNRLTTKECAAASASVSIQ